jgi:hypothetical protein
MQTITIADDTNGNIIKAVITATAHNTNAVGIAIDTANLR